MTAGPNKRITALVVAAGRGKRAGLELPKQYRDLCGQAVLTRSLRAFAQHKGIGEVIAVIHPDDREYYDRAVEGLNIRQPVVGSATRQGSVHAGLEALAPDPPDFVLIHDGARPLVSPDIIDRVIAALATSDAVIPVMPVAETIKRVDQDAITGTVDRSGLYLAQTPQGFRFKEILAAHRRFAIDEFTDDAALAEKAGMKVTTVAGERCNIKLTQGDDFDEAARILMSACADIRTGQGFDVHRFGPGDHVWLCGVRVPHTHGLTGHSDADVGLHALTDAVLGAVAAGDIGRHFPPSDERWRGASSDRFLRHAHSLVMQRNGIVAHADVTLICELPKIAPHGAAMIARIAEILQIERSRVSVKATTTEGLGFTGRGEGIAAQALATIRLPG
jgi:2-C-methyl-D-erythritol 4-phosphate cytidylyltransferase/2-C-methyl-D-erythritol 2,4-cyclodiphosphate synthase